MLVESDIISYFNTNWNTLIIPEPEMRSGRIDESSRKFPAIYIRVGKASSRPVSITNSAMIVVTPFEVEVVGKSDADITDLVNQVYYHMSNRYGSGYWTSIQDHAPKEYSDRRKSAVISCLETKFAIVANGV